MFSEPLISCIMPTRGRERFATEAVGYWQAQTYRNRELVIIDEEKNPSFPSGCSGARIQYGRISRPLRVGAKRNIAVSRATGDIIAHWDDDDYSAPCRLEDQVELLLELGVEVVGYHAMRFKHGEDWYRFHLSDDYPLGTSLMYLRSYWETHPFDTEALGGEDGRFVMGVRGTPQSCFVDAGDLMYATVHPGNTSPRQLDNQAFQRIK